MSRLATILGTMVMLTSALHGQTNAVAAQAREIAATSGDRLSTNSVPLAPAAGAIWQSQAARPQKGIWQLRPTEAPDRIRRGGFSYRGPLVRAVKSPKPSQALQLFNPLAPVSLGNGGTPPVVWDTFSGSRPKPRAFRDPVTEEPLLLISIGR